MEGNFVQADSSNLPRIDAFMVALFFKNNADYYSAELKNVKIAVILFIIVFHVIQVDGRLQHPNVPLERGPRYPWGNLEIHNDSDKLQAVLVRQEARRRETRPLVEVGPGFFKTEILSFPDAYQAIKFKNLLMLKQKREENKTLSTNTS